MGLQRRTVDAIRFARDPTRMRYATDAMLSEAALLISRAIVHIEERGSHRELRVAAFAMLDDAGNALTDEMRRRAVKPTPNCAIERADPTPA